MAVELENVVSLPDILLTDHFDLNIPVPPGGGDGRALLIRNMSAVLPGRSNAVVGVTLHRHKVNFAGRRQYPGQFSASYVDSADSAIIRAIRAWQNQTTDQATGLPRPKSDYATTAMVTIYDSNNIPVEQRVFHGLWINNVADIGLAGGEGGSQIQIQVTFTYDYWMPGAF